MCAPVAEALGNTPTISRKSYIHPSLIDLCKVASEVKARIQSAAQK
jgi:DNA topoisomerase-1